MEIIHFALKIIQFLLLFDRIHIFASFFFLMLRRIEFPWCKVSVKSMWCFWLYRYNSTERNHQLSMDMIPRRRMMERKIAKEEERRRVRERERDKKRKKDDVAGQTSEFPYYIHVKIIDSWLIVWHHGHYWQHNEITALLALHVRVHETIIHTMYIRISFNSESIYMSVFWLYKF